MGLGIQPRERSELHVDRMNVRLAGDPPTLDSERPRQAKNDRVTE